MIERPARTILANTVSSIMADAPSDAYRRAMAAVTPRKLWQAYPGDCVVMLAPCSAAFRDYVANTLDLDIGQVEVIAPAKINGVHALEVARDLGATKHIASRPELAPFVLDEPVLEFARKSAVRILPYTRLPTTSTLQDLRLINTKDGFRKTAAALGLPIADGGFAENLSDLKSGLKRFLRDHRSAIVKTNRATNGYGNTVIHSGSANEIDEQVEMVIAGQPEPDCGWVYEEYLPFISTPSLEMSVDDSGVSIFYSCDQRTVNNAWTGMITPAEEGPFHSGLMSASTAVGSWLHGRGYRGIFDVDCGVFNNGFVVTEANVRRTGGTYLEELARRLRPKHSLVHWRADARPGTCRMDFAEAVRALRTAGLSDSSAEAQAVLTADTFAIDGKWRYLVVGQSATAVAAIEQSVKAVLGIG
jgi:Pre ATP-grasp domain/PGM1 C-terminal domain